VACRPRHARWDAAHSEAIYCERYQVTACNVPLTACLKESQVPRRLRQSRPAVCAIARKDSGMLSAKAMGSRNWIQATSLSHQILLHSHGCSSALSQGNVYDLARRLGMVSGNVRIWQVS